MGNDTEHAGGQGEDHLGICVVIEPESFMIVCRSTPGFVTLFAVDRGTSKYENSVRSLPQPDKWIEGGPRRAKRQNRLFILWLRNKFTLAR